MYAIRSYYAVITSDIPGMTEIVDDGVNGLTFKSEDSSSLADSIHRALSLTEHERRHLTNQALELMQTKHSWERIGELTLLEYEIV